MYDLKDLTAGADIAPADLDRGAFVALDVELGQLAVFLDADSADDLAQVLAQVGADSYVGRHRADVPDHLGAAGAGPDRWLPVVTELVVAAQQARDTTTRPLTLVPATPVVDAATGTPWNAR